MVACPYCGEAFVNAFQLGPHKRVCWKTCTFSGDRANSVFSNSDDSESVSSVPTDDSASVSSVPTGNDTTPTPICLRELMRRPISGRNHTWGVSSNFRAQQPSNAPLVDPQLTADYTEASVCVTLVCQCLCREYMSRRCD